MLLSMDKQTIRIFSILMVLVVASESSVIVPRYAPKEGASGDGELEKDKKPELSSGIWDPEDPFNTEKFGTGFKPPGPKDNGNGNKEDKVKPGAKPDRFPSNAGRDKRPKLDDTESEIENRENVHRGNDFGKTADDDFHEPFDGEEDFENPAGNGRQPALPGFDEGDDSINEEAEESHKEEGNVRFSEEDDYETDFDKSVDGDIGSEVPVFGDGDESIHEEADESHKGEDYDEPREEEEDETEILDVAGEKGENEPGFFGEGSVFDTAFFNLDQVRKYFNQIERALGHTFRQTMDEARLLNGTYANTTDEEVDINGTKYIVQKSIIKDADNDSSIYIETLTSKEKLQGTNGMEVRR